MKEKEAPEEEAAERPGRLAVLALRLIDAGSRSLHKLRDRLEPPAPDDDSQRDRRQFDDAGDEDTAAVVPRQKTLLQRALILLLCLLLGVATGGLIAYRAFSKLIDSRTLLIENMQIDISELRKFEERALVDKAKYRMELNDYRKQLREAQFELEASEKRGADLKRQLDAQKRATLPPAAHARNSRTVRSRTPQKTGTCITRPGDPPGKLQECLDKFNQP